MKKGLLMLPLAAELLCDYDDENYRTVVYGFTPGKTTELPIGFTYLGFVVSGKALIRSADRKRLVHAGDYFSVIGPAKVTSRGYGIASGSAGYKGFNLVGGPIEEKGKLRYINGCTDTLLVPPVRKGDACMNHLHFPPHTVQTPHTHPSVRVNVVYKGSGVCLVPEDKQREVSLIPGYAFVMKTETLHSFNTKNDSMDVITFHPDSDTGMTDDDHPMVNRTVVDGVSARYLSEIRT